MLNWTANEHEYRLTGPAVKIHTNVASRNFDAAVKRRWRSRNDHICSFIGTTIKTFRVIIVMNGGNIILILENSLYAGY